MSLTAAVTNISRCSLHDGPGVRTVVYLKGCGLQCRWCHNPETLSPLPEILFVPGKCIGCGRCVCVCPDQHILRDGRIAFLRNGCTACGKCVQRCPTGALTICGESMCVDEVRAEVLKDRHYYGPSGGGVTLSGGECLLHSAFTAALLKACRAQGIHTAIESALFVPWTAIESVMEYVDLFFLDLKIADPEKHRLYTGQSNERILDNLHRLSHAVTGKITLRIPMIPGVNDSKEDLRKFGGLISSLGAGVTAVELLRYNHLAQSKYLLCGRDYEAFAVQPQSDEEMNVLCRDLSSHLPSRIPVFTKS